jgi:PAS domain S-box-containing protein/diguanylate cyclase (GGDEF)-like protein
MSEFHDFELCRSILESLPIGLAVIDAQKRIVFWSNGAERITGHSRYEVIGKSSCADQTLLYCDKPDCELCREDCPLAQTIKNAHPTDSIAFLHHKAGHEIPVRARAVPVRNAHGSIIGAVAIFEDHGQSASTEPRDDLASLPGCVDEITSVASHPMMLSHLRDALGTFNELHIPFGILCLRLEGLDGFRASCGPDAASSLLRVTARTLESSILRTDLVGRWSDDQFLVILNGCRDDAIFSVRERIRKMLANDTIEWWGERRSLPLSISQASASPGDTVATLIDRAQKSLNAASTARAQAAAAVANPFSGSR